MKIKGILFDKDGTLIDFYSLWLNAALEVIPQFLAENGIEVTGEMTDYVLRAIGVSDDRVDPRGALAYKSYEEIAEDIRAALEKRQIVIETGVIHRQLVELFQKSVTKDEIEFQTFTDLRKLFRGLKEAGIFLGVATADTQRSAENCVKSLGVMEYLDYIGGENGKIRPKPDPDMFEEFRKLCGLGKSEIAVVGDSYNDMKFAKKCGGTAVGVLSGVSREEDFGNLADYVIESVAELDTVLET